MALSARAPCDAAVRIRRARYPTRSPMPLALHDSTRACASPQYRQRGYADRNATAAELASYTSRVQNRIVARYADGRVLKGNTADFAPMKPTFHVVPTPQT